MSEKPGSFAQDYSFVVEQSLSSDGPRLKSGSEVTRLKSVFEARAPCRIGNFHALWDTVLVFRSRIYYAALAEGLRSYSYANLEVGLSALLMMSDHDCSAANDRIYPSYCFLFFCVFYWVRVPWLLRASVLASASEMACNVTMRTSFHKEWFRRVRKRALKKQINLKRSPSITRIWPGDPRFVSLQIPLLPHRNPPVDHSKTHWNCAIEPQEKCCTRCGPSLSPQLAYQVRSN